MEDNSVEAEYILMEQACGTLLGDIWGNIEMHSKKKIVDDIVSIEQKLLSVSFSQFPRIRLGKLLTPSDMAIYILQKIPFQGAKKQRFLAIFRKK